MINAEFSRMKRRFRFFFALKMQSRLLRCCRIASGEGTWKELFVPLGVPWVREPDFESAVDKN